MTEGSHDLDRFLRAQEAAYPVALAELRAGAKRSHWMWFVFPQIAGLGTSPTARHFAIRDSAEARDYLAHPILGQRYLESAAALLPHASRSAADILGDVDALKLRSSLTLFAQAGAPPIVAQALAAFFPGPDPATLRLLEATRPSLP